MARKKKKPNLELNKNGRTEGGNRPFILYLLNSCNS